MLYKTKIFAFPGKIFGWFKKMLYLCTPKLNVGHKLLSVMSATRNINLVLSTQKATDLVACLRCAKERKLEELTHKGELLFS